MPNINPKHGACSCSMVYNPHKYVSRGGGDLTGTSGDIGAENWEIRWRGSQLLKNVRIKSSPQTPSKIKKK